MLAVCPWLPPAAGGSRGLVSSARSCYWRSPPWALRSETRPRRGPALPPWRKRLNSPATADETSFPLIQLQAPPARGLSSLSPAAPARTAAPGSLGEERVFPHPRTGFLAGPDLGHAQHLAARPLRLLKGSRGTQPAACSRPAAQDTEGEDNPWGVDVRRGGMCRPSLAPACRKPAGLPPLPRGLPSPAPVMSDGASCELWPLLAAPQGLWGADPLSWDALGCLMPQAIQAHPDCDDRAVLLGGGVTCHMLPENCGEDSGTMAQPRRARLYRCHPPIQTSKSSLAPPATLPLKVRKCVWLNPPPGGRMGWVQLCPVGPHSSCSGFPATFPQAWLLPLCSATVPATSSLLFGRRA